MRLETSFLVAATVGLVFAATSVWAAPFANQALRPAGGAADICASAAQRAAAIGLVNGADIASCDLAVRLAYFEPNRAAALTNRAALLFVAGNYDAVIADSTAALVLNDGIAEALVNRGAALLQEHRAAAAAEDFSHALALAPDHPERVYFNRGIAREDLGDFSGAYSDYREAARLNPQWDLPRQELQRFNVTPAVPVT